MSLSIGIVGLPNVGKSTLFNALTNQSALAANYPFATIEPNTGIVPVPDERLAKLAEIFKPEKVIPATVTFVDIAGLVAGASKGEGLGNQFLANIRECDAIAEVVRVFKDENVTHVANQVHPEADIGTITTELVLADLQTVDNRLNTISGRVKTDPKLRPQLEALEKVRATLDTGTPLFNTDYNHEAVADLHLLSAKPVLYIFNVDEEALGDSAKQAELEKLVDPAPCVFICAKLEAELAGLEIVEAKELLESVGQTNSGLEQLIANAYDLLGLQSFLTAGPKEVRAWTVKSGANAPEAAGVIHTDFERGFIAAEVVKYSDLIQAGSKANAKAAGKLRTEGKDYTMRDGDVVEFRFNV